MLFHYMTISITNISRHHAISKCSKITNFTRTPAMWCCRNNGTKWPKRQSRSEHGWWSSACASCVNSTWASVLPHATRSQSSITCANTDHSPFTVPHQSVVLSSLTYKKCHSCNIVCWIKTNSAWDGRVSTTSCGPIEYPECYLALGNRWLKDWHPGRGRYSLMLAHQKNAGKGAIKRVALRQNKW